MAVLTPARSLGGPRPATSSSPVEPVFCHLFAAADGLDGDRATVLSVLAVVADPRARRGVRHRPGGDPGAGGVRGGGGLPAGHPSRRVGWPERCGRPGPTRAPSRPLSVVL